MSNFFEKAITVVEKESASLATVLKAVLSHLSPETKANIDAIVSSSEQITETANSVLTAVEAVAPLPPIQEAATITGEVLEAEKIIDQVV